ncbi:hypothetical protein HYH03_017504 [Edaphochlamys debaryana]|uniref:Helitron helicase-like domain-containing protein n=1 Tax=Edaphochlamys debaryana TaxID=47281 RepID=A0A836BP24_9CHLO|nr:hypothetical protein HYH03_017504 [Edaphochlamys debaryana]|eukprot:KAG2483625.1 hypothetical protein HYH03_017504 [Edaphochlamys debaryana]
MGENVGLAPDPSRLHTLRGATCGISDLDLITTNAPPHDLTAVLREAAEDPNFVARLESGERMVLTSRGGDALVNDYNPLVPILAYPHLFPRGTGQRPKGMGEGTCAMIRLMRWSPSGTPSSDDPLFVLDMHDTISRHLVNTEASIQFNATPEQVREISTLTPAEVTGAFAVMAEGLRGEKLRSHLHALPPKVGKLVRAARAVASRVPGSPQEAWSLRSRAYAAWQVFGPPTCAVTLNPSPLDSEYVFRMDGQRYRFTADGYPRDRPLDRDCWAYTTSHPTYLAQFALTFVTAFRQTFCSPCGLFGTVDHSVFKFETNQRGDLHVHCLLWQRELPPELLQEALRGELQEAMLRFMESIQTQWFPSPTQHAPAYGVQASAAAPEEAPAANPPAAAVHNRSVSA